MKYVSAVLISLLARTVVSAPITNTIDAGSATSSPSVDSSASTITDRSPAEPPYEATQDSNKRDNSASTGSPEMGKGDVYFIGWSAYTTWVPPKIKRLVWV
ncbi:hypothetical protein M432DRAFT_669753 [Thermoascus aurantiacus ATCC 26904]